MQKITLLGFLGKDPQEKFTQKGVKLVTFSLAVSPRKKETVWYTCDLWGKRIEIFAKMLPYLKKGTKVLLCGDFHTPSFYTTRDGSQVISLVVEPNFIHFCSPPVLKTEPSPPPEQTSFLKNVDPSQEIPF